MSAHQGSVIESLGVYLPPKEVSTSEVVKGCAKTLLLPLERLTGIKSRRMAGEKEFSFDLAVKAVEDCLAVSRYGPDDIDLLVCSHISHCDGPDKYSYEPSTAARLRAAFGFGRALAFDIKSACAGMFTGIYLVDALIRAGAIRRGMVVSGEYITHLTQTAQKEIRGLADPRLPCLTLGDAGAAVIVDARAGANFGFKGLGFYTMGAHSSLCVAKVTDEPHGGAIMKTDMLRLAQLSIPAFLKHAVHMGFQLGWSPAEIDHVLPHQTSKTSLGAGSRELKRVASALGDFQDKVIDNVERRGNTASTSHFVALKDCFLDGRVKTGQSVLFGILASGITIGTALHRFDDLPDRIRKAGGDLRKPAARPAAPEASFLGRDCRPRVRVEAVGILKPGQASGQGTLPMLTAAAENCLGESAHERADINVLLSSGVYRTDFLTEPAIASLLAGALRMNADPRALIEKTTLAFDVTNGGLGPLVACQLASELIRSRTARTVMVAASEVENNAAAAPDCPRGVRETASALVLDAPEDGETGFGAFCFRAFPKYEGSLRVYGRCRSLRIGNRFAARLFVEKSQELEEHFIACISVAVGELLGQQGLTASDIRVVLPPQISPGFINRLSAALGFEREKVVNVSGDGDLFTSSLAYGLEHLRRGRLARGGDIGLVIGVGAGIHVGCALYHF